MINIDVDNDIGIDIYIYILINDRDFTLSNIKQHQATLRNRNIRISPTENC